MIRKLLKMIEKLLGRICYRCWQFKQVLFPKIDEKILHEALEFAPPCWRPYLMRLRPSEQAHVLRVFAAVKTEPGLSDDERQVMLQLALAHDIGKGVTRHSLFFKIVKVFFPISNAAHCIAGARLLRRLRADPNLIRMVLRHHQLKVSQPLLEKFQKIDDRL